MTKTRHALTNAEYQTESPYSVRVVDGDNCVVQERAATTAQSQENQR